MKEEEIEFNNGFVTALALFYGHAMQWGDEKINQIMKRDHRIYAATDHLYNIQYPRVLLYKAPELKEKIEQFVKDAFKVRLADVTKEEADALFERCKNLLKEIDEKLFNLEVTVNYS